MVFFFKNEFKHFFISLLVIHVISSVIVILIFEVNQYLCFLLHRRVIYHAFTSCWCLSYSSSMLILSVTLGLGGCECFYFFQLLFFLSMPMRINHEYVDIYKKSIRLFLVLDLFIILIEPPISTQIFAHPGIQSLFYFLNSL